MNLKQAYYIKTIAQCGSITTAAKKLFVSQPSLSQMLRQLEQEIGLPIFDRSTSPLRLTYAGEKYLYAAERILAVNSELESQLREIRHEHSGRLRLGISVTRAMPGRRGSADSVVSGDFSKIGFSGTVDSSKLILFNKCNQCLL